MTTATPLDSSVDDIETVFANLMAARQALAAVTFDRRSRELTELMQAQQALADMTRERDEAVAALAAVTSEHTIADESQADYLAWLRYQAANAEQERDLFADHWMTERAEYRNGGLVLIVLGALGGALVWLPVGVWLARLWGSTS